MDVAESDSSDSENDSKTKTANTREKNEKHGSEVEAVQMSVQNSFDAVSNDSFTWLQYFDTWRNILFDVINVLFMFFVEKNRNMNSRVEEIKFLFSSWLMFTNKYA